MGSRGLHAPDDRFPCPPFWVFPPAPLLRRRNGRVAFCLPTSSHVAQCTFLPLILRPLLFLLDFLQRQFQGKVACNSALLSSHCFLVFVSFSMQSHQTSRPAEQGEASIFAFLSRFIHSSGFNFSLPTAFPNLSCHLLIICHPSFSIDYFKST